MWPSPRWAHSGIRQIKRKTIGSLLKYRLTKRESTIRTAVRKGAFKVNSLGMLYKCLGCGPGGSITVMTVQILNGVCEPKQPFSHILIHYRLIIAVSWFLVCQSPMELGRSPRQSLRSTHGFRVRSFDFQAFNLGISTMFIRASWVRNNVIVGPSHLHANV